MAAPEFEPGCESKVIFMLVHQLCEIMFMTYVLSTTAIARALRNIRTKPIVLNVSPVQGLHLSTVWLWQAIKGGVDERVST